MLQLGLPPNWVIVPADDKLLAQIAKLYPNDSSWQEQVSAAQKIIAGGNSVLALSLRRHRTENNHYLAPSVIITGERLKTTTSKLTASLLSAWKQSQEIQVRHIQDIHIAGVDGVFFQIDIRQKNPDDTVYHIYMQSALLPLNGKLYSITLNDAAPAQTEAEKTFMTILQTLHIAKQP